MKLLSIRPGPLDATTQPGREAIKVAIHRVNAAIFCIILAFTAMARHVVAQGPPTSGSFSTSAQWLAADEVTFGGAIEKVLAQNPIGTPAGLILSMTGSQHVLLVSLGPNLSPAVIQLLTPGTLIQVTGIAETHNGQTCLLVRELQIGQQKIEIRNLRGFLIHPSPPPTAVTPSSKTHTGGIGGAQ
jgi:hypothetical protein